MNLPRYPSVFFVFIEFFVFIPVFPSIIREDQANGYIIWYQEQGFPRIWIVLPPLISHFFHQNFSFPYQFRKFTKKKPIWISFDLSIWWAICGFDPRISCLRPFPTFLWCFRMPKFVGLKFSPKAISAPSPTRRAIRRRRYYRSNSRTSEWRNGSCFGTVLWKELVIMIMKLWSKLILRS